MIEVAVIGAGTAGIVTARHLISAGLRPTIFEAAKTIGGAWTPSSAIQSNRHVKFNEYSPRKMWGGMHTNLSKYTCQFTDWPWPEDASTFPSVEEMNRYLQSYSDNFLHSDSCNFQFECKVTNIEQLDITADDLAIQDGKSYYKVEWMDLKTNTRTNKDFGGVVIATGFFNTRKFPSCLKDQAKLDDQSSSKPEVIHSSDYITHKSFKNKHVAVIGSSFSALEISADLSKSASRIVNIVPSVPWVLPRWVSKAEENQIIEPTNKDVHSNDSTKTILPIDLALYQRNDPFPQKEIVQLDEQSCQKRHKFLRALVGSKQKYSPLGEPLDWSGPPFVVISDEYLDLIRENQVDVVKGRLDRVNEDGSLSTSDSQTIENIDTVICCTGYTPNLNSILSTNILDKLEYDADDTFNPLSLAWDVLHPSLPGFGFCGMYRGPYMGIMDLQARLLAEVMSGRLVIDKEKVQTALDTNKLIRTTRPRAQFPRFDYTGFMDELSMLCYNGKYPTTNAETGDIIVPSLYQPDEDISKQATSDLQKELLRGQDGSRMPPLILQSILGNWTYDRNIVHFENNKVERVSGTVKYTKYSHLSQQSDDERSDDPNQPTGDSYVKYREDGLYELTPTQKFEVFREYEYIAKHDALEIYFVEGGKRAHLFLSLKFVPETNQPGGDYWVKATSDHLCIKDLYSGNFRVKLDGLTASEIIIKYRVKGPAKDYESTTVLKPLL